MRKFFKLSAFSLLIMMAVTSCSKRIDDDFDENPFYYNDKGEKVLFSIKKDKVIIKVKSEAEAKVLAEHSVFLSAYNAAYVWVIASIDPLKTNLDDLLQIQGVVDASYGLVEYNNSGNNLQYLSDQIFVQCKNPKDVLESTGLSKRAETIEMLSPSSELYLITLNLKLDDILSTCRKLYKSGKCGFAEPSFYREIKFMSF